MLVGTRLFGDGGGVDAALMREGGFAHIRRMPVGLAVQKLVELARERGQRAKRLHADARLEAARIILLQQQRWDDRGEVRVAAALAKAVQRTLNLPRARANRRQRIGDSVFGIVVRVDAHVIAWDVPDDLGHDVLHLMRERAAIGVAEYHPARAGLIRGFRASQRVSGVGLVAVEEMLAVDERLALRTRTASTEAAMASRFSSRLMPSATST